MAAHAALRTAVTDYLDAERCSIPVAIRVELQGLSRLPAPTGSWAKTSLTQLGWLGNPVPLPPGDLTELALDIQDDMAVAAPLERDDQHWGESTIIALGLGLKQLDVVMVSEDYDARVAAKQSGLSAMSLTRLLHHAMLDGHRSPVCGRRRRLHNRPRTCR
jgi:hypothetical protein